MGLLIKLKNGDTALKSLKYGNDRPDGGDSGQPYIKSPIDQPSSISDEDTILRGGLKAPSSALEDVSRLTKYFFDFKNPDGLLFVAKQNILSRISPKTEASFGLAYGGLSKNIDLKTGATSVNQNNGFFNSGIYTPLSTLAQARVGYLGTHLNKQGIDPTGLIPSLDINKYQNVAYANNKSIPEDPKVPLSLVRKSQRASDKAGRKTSKLLNQQLKTQSELNANFQGLNNLPSSEFNQQTKSQKVISGFLEKWDKYLDEQSLKKLKRKENAADKAIDKSTSLYNQVQEAESAPKVYTNRLLKLWNDSGLNLNSAFSSTEPVLYSYGGGPDSILGVGKTNIKFATTNDGVTPSRTNSIFVNNQFSLSSISRPEVRYSTINIFGDENSSVSLRYASTKNTSLTEYDLFGNNNYLEIYNNTTSDRLGITTNPSNPSTGNNNSDSSQFQTWNEQDLIGFSSINPNSRTTPDFRNILPSDYTKTFSGTPYTQNNNIETLFNLGSPGQQGNISDYKKGKIINSTSSPLDKITYSYLYKSDVGKPRFGKEYDDLIPFRIGILNNDSYKMKYMHFRAFIEDFSDGYQAEWKGIEYMGRAETFYKYNGFKRDMSLSFIIVAQSRQELTPMYDKLNFLASSLAPEYLDVTSTGYMAGNIAYLTLGDYIVEQPGIINSLDFDISQDSPWETARDENGGLIYENGVYGEDVRRLPFMITVQMKFTPIHRFRPQKQSFKEDTSSNDSYKLLKPGNQKYIDQVRPVTSNYDKEGEKKEKEVFINSDEENILNNNNTLI